MLRLPNYFLIDLPPGAELTPLMITEACQALRRNRRAFLAERPVAQIVRVLADLARHWLDDQYPFRRHALEYGPKETGFSAPTIASGLDNFFGQLTLENLNALLAQDLGHLTRLDAFTASDLEARQGRAALAQGFPLLVHMAGGKLPNPALMSVILGLLVKSAQFVKCPAGWGFLPRLFAHSLYEAEPKLGACLELAMWKGGNAAVEQALYAEADCLTATGSDETLAAIRAKLPEKTRFLGYGDRVSFAYISREALGGLNSAKVTAAAARDIAAWDQLGCLSPHAIYVEAGGQISPERFAELLAEELKRVESVQPRRQLEPNEAASIATRRGFYEIRAAHSPDTRCWFSADSTAWSVVFENDPTFTRSCLDRFIFVKAVGTINQLFEGADAIQQKISTVGLAAAGARAEELAGQFARWGVTRICPLGQMQNPPLTWRHDGAPALAGLVTWSDWEF